MPQFFSTLPTPQGVYTESRKRRLNTQNPVGLIGQQGDYTYGFDGRKYWVAEGVLQTLVTLVHLTFDEAKMLFEALVWVSSEVDYSRVNQAVRAGRKAKYNGQTLFWFYVEQLS